MLDDAFDNEQEACGHMAPDPRPGSAQTGRLPEPIQRHENPDADKARGYHLNNKNWRARLTR